MRYRRVTLTIILLLLLARSADGKIVQYTVKRGDTLWAIAKKFHTAIPFIKRLNNLKKDTIYPGQKLKIYSGGIKIIVIKSEFRLLVCGEDVVLAEYPVAIGKNNSTPTGRFIIKTKVVNPDWWNPDTGERIKFGDPRHEIGTRWMGFNVKGLGIHGTNDPKSIGKAASRGCIRMRNEDIEEIFWAIPRGTVVEIVEDAPADIK